MPIASPVVSYQHLDVKAILNEEEIKETASKRILARGNPFN